MKKSFGKKMLAGLAVLGFVCAFAFAGCVNPTDASNGNKLLTWDDPTFNEPDGPTQQQ